MTFEGAHRGPLVVTLIVAGIAVVAPYFGVCSRPNVGLGVNMSGSAPRGLYRVVPEGPARGALVVACLPPVVAAFGRTRGYLGAGACADGGQPVLKRIGAVAGDVIDLTAERVTVSGVTAFTRPIEPEDSLGRSLPRMPFGPYRVADNEVWLFGLSHGRSWDSRYFGPVPLAAVRGVVRPVLTVRDIRP